MTRLALFRRARWFRLAPSAAHQREESLSYPTTRRAIMPPMLSTCSRMRGIALGLALLAASSWGCSRKERSSLGRPLCKVFQHWCEETSEEKYPNGTVKSRGPVLQDEKDNYIKVGLWTAWHENGQKKEEGEYQDGRRAGDWMYWHENGRKLGEGKFANGKEAGVWTYWYENGQKQEEGEYENGQKAGTWTYWHENGQKHEQGVYQGGWKAGVWTSWYKAGQKLGEIRYAEGGRVMQHRIWDEKGEEIKLLAPP